MSTLASLEAFEQIVDQLPRKRGIVYQTIKDQFSEGLTIDECCKALSWRYSTISARIFELAEAGLICSRGDTRGGQTVWVVTEPENVAYHRDQRRAARAGVQAKVVAFEGVGGPEAYGPDQTMNITVAMKRSEWERVKNHRHARFA